MLNASTDNYLSGIAQKINRYTDDTGYSLIASVGLETAGHAACTAAAIIDLSRYKENSLYLTMTNGPAANAGTTGLTVIMESRPSSAIAWFPFRVDTGVTTTGRAILNVVGSGANASGVLYFRDVRITIENTTDSSGTCTVAAWMLSRT